MISQAEKEIIIRMKDENVTWSQMAVALRKKKETIRKWYQKYKKEKDLPPKEKIRNRITDGRVGLTIKKIMRQDPSTSLTLLQKRVSDALGPNVRAPKRTTLHSFLKENNIEANTTLRNPIH